MACLGLICQKQGAPDCSKRSGTIQVSFAATERRSSWDYGRSRTHNAVGKMNHPILFVQTLGLGVVLALFSACATSPSPTAVALAPTATAILPAATSSPIPTDTPTSTPTLTPTDTPTLTPTITPTPTNTPTETATATATIIPSVTPSKTPKVRPTAAPTKDVSYAAPTLLNPPDSFSINQCEAHQYQWSWTGTLGPNEHFDIRIWQPGSPQHASITWTDATSYALPRRPRPVKFEGYGRVNGRPNAIFGHPCPMLAWASNPGQYQWSVAVIRGSNGILDAQVSPEAAPRIIIYTP